MLRTPAALVPFAALLAGLTGACGSHRRDVAPPDPAASAASAPASAGASAIAAAPVDAAAPPIAEPAPALPSTAKLLAQAKVNADGIAFTPDGAQVALVKGGKLTLRAAADLAPAAGLPGGVVRATKGFAPVLDASKGSLVLVGRQNAFDSATGKRLELPPPPHATCSRGGYTYSADASRASIHCDDPKGDEVVHVVDAMTGASIGPFARMESAAPACDGTITESGRFVQWRCRADGAFQEISSHVTGPHLGSQAVMSPGEGFLYVAPDLNWYGDDKTAPQIVKPQNGRPVYALPFWARSVRFSPADTLFVALTSSFQKDIAKLAPKKTLVYATAQKEPVLTLDVPIGEVTAVAFSRDEHRLALLTKDGTLRVYQLS